MQIPLTNPLDTKSISQSPTIARGRNLLGLILMQLADQIVKVCLISLTFKVAEDQNGAITAVPWLHS